MFTPGVHRFLLSLAREAITMAVKTRQVLQPSEVHTAFMQRLGVFVTLTTDGELRGCIGFPEPQYPLYEAIIHAGIAAALQDPRFPPVTSPELKELSIEISVLSPLEEIAPQDIEVGRHGLVVEKGRMRGLLLPQVPVEWGWDRNEFLAQTCRKAGLPADAWQEETTLYGFTAEVFSEAKQEMTTGEE